MAAAYWGEVVLSPWRLVGEFAANFSGGVLLITLGPVGEVSLQFFRWNFVKYSWGQWGMLAANFVG